MTPLSLGDMLEDLRAEVGASLSPGHNLNQTETQYYVLRRTQRELYAAYDWPTLITEERIPVNAGERYIKPDTISYEQVNEMWTVYGTDWRPMSYGVKPQDYAAYDPESDERSYPVEKYRAVPETGEIELWPIPNQATTVLVRGQMALKPLKAADDMSTLDGTLIVLFAASDLLYDWDRKSAAQKAGKAMAYLRSLRKNLISHKQRVTRLAPDRTPMPRPGLDYIPEGYPRP